MPRKCCSLGDAKELLEEWEDDYLQATIYVLLPDASDLSDEDEDYIVNARNLIVDDVLGELEVEMVRENDFETSLEDHPSGSSSKHQKTKSYLSSALSQIKE